VPSTAPQQSTRGFVAPTSIPVKKTPDITDIIEVRGERCEVRGEKSEVRIPSPPDDGKTDLPPPLSPVGAGNRAAEAEPQPNEPQPNEPQLNEPQPNIETKIQNSKFKIQNFSIHWHTMFNEVFALVPTIYIPLKDSLPEIENNIIKVTVKNEVQKEHFEAKKREVLEYLRSNFDEQIEDIVVETNEQMETKKIIYDTKDKLQNFKEQNEEFEDFLQILDLKIKE
jgi:hypothetical protein